MLIAVTEDDFCRTISLDDLSEEWSFRLGHAVKDAALLGDRLVVLDGMRGACVYEITGENRLEEVDRRALPECDDLVIASCDDDRGAMMMLIGGSRGAGDTLAVWLIDKEEGITERATLPLPARVEAYRGRGAELALQLEGGLLLRFDLGPVLDAARQPTSEGLVGDAAFLPVDIYAMTLEGVELIGVGRGGVVVRGTPGAFAPNPARARRSRCGVTVLEIPEGE